MSDVRIFQRSFGGGEVTPEFWGRIDDSRYQIGLAACRNFLVKPHGPLENRAGTRFVRETKYSAKRSRLLPFTYNTTQTMVLEVGERYVRFHTDGASELAQPGAAAYTTYQPAVQVAITITTPAMLTFTPSPSVIGGELVVFSTTGALPAPLVAGRVYRLVVEGPYVRVRERDGQSNINTSGSQSGVHTMSFYYAAGTQLTHGGQAYQALKDGGAGTQAPPSGNWMRLVAGEPYEIPTPYLEGDLMDLTYVQSADVLTIAHPGYPPAELRRLGPSRWVYAPISFTSAQSPPAGLSSGYSGDAGLSTYTYRYVVTAVGETVTEESAASVETSCTGNLFTTGGKVTITWKASPTASRYYIYKFSGGLFGYIGQTTDLSFVDENIAADVSRTPPIDQNPFELSGGYPGAVSYFEQRRCFAGSLAKPQHIWMTKSGTESNLNYSLPIRDDDAITFRVAAREANTIRHIVPLTDLLLLTSGAEWRVTSVNSDAVTPSSISVSPQSYIGADTVTPVVVANNVIYVAARGGHLREMAYSSNVNGYLSGDLSLRAPHLFDEKLIEDMGFGKAPYPIIWAVSSDGALLGFTYIPEQQVGAWHRHDTLGGKFESVAVVAEGQDDVPYFVVQREVGGRLKRYVERLTPRHFATREDSFFVDCGLSYSGPPVSTLSGLGHLEGAEVAILGDGAVFPRQVVVDGTITLDAPVSVAHVGLPLVADMQTLPIAFETAAYGQGQIKNVTQAWLRVYRSGGVSIGPSWERLVEHKQRTTQPWGSPPGLKTELLRMPLPSGWAQEGQICVRQAEPLPLTLVALTVEFAVGGA